MRCVGWQEEACLGLGGPGINVCYQSKSNRLSPLDRQITTPENQASRLSLIPPTPLSKGLVIDFFAINESVVSEIISVLSLHSIGNKMQDTKLKLKTSSQKAKHAETRHHVTYIIHSVQRF